MNEDAARRLAAVLALSAVLCQDSRSLLCLPSHDELSVRFCVHSLRAERGEEERECGFARHRQARGYASTPR